MVPNDFYLCIADLLPLLLVLPRLAQQGRGCCVLGLCVWQWHKARQAPVVLWTGSSICIMCKWHVVAAGLQHACAAAGRPSHATAVCTAAFALQGDDCTYPAPVLQCASLAVTPWFLSPSLSRGRRRSRHGLWTTTSTLRAFAQQQHAATKVALVEEINTLEGSVVFLF